MALRVQAGWLADNMFNLPERGLCLVLRKDQDCMVDYGLYSVAKMIPHSYREWNIDTALNLCFLRDKFLIRLK